ncbi:MAG TPA: type I DNA topoisomerase [Candidatus Babeliales bacterium]|nr:type I DNA topoisomerase [Candidatus Babeliales bacterium]
MKKLIIVESPAKIKTITKFLDKDFVIMSTMGHIKDLPSKTIGVSIDDKGINIEYVTLEGKEAVIAGICKQASTSDIIYLAPDPDREGEIIGWHTAQEIAKVIKKNAQVYRIAFNEITQSAVLEAINHPGEINLKLVEAQQARRILDRWVGYEVSPILWRKIAKGLSAGRVQSVALRMICDREKAIRTFVPEEYWTIIGNFKHNKSIIAAPLTNIGKSKAEIKNEESAKKVVDVLKNEKYIIDSIVDKVRIRNPLPPFMTSTLQQAAYNMLGFSVKKTMQIAQHLYEGIALNDPSTPIALITYMRTDSLRISDTALQQARLYITKHYPSNYLPSKVNLFEKKTKAKTQDAHEAIRPIDIDLTPDKIRHYLPSDEAKLYDLIWKRFVSCQMKPAEYAQRQVTIKGGIYTFKVTGSTLIFDGFLRLYQEEEEEGEKEDKITLPADIQEKNNVNLDKIDSKQHFTQPQPRFTESTLVKELEKEGIGRPSTYVAVLNTIRARSYTTLEKKKFVPTELGMLVTEMLVKNLPEIMNPKFTATMEENLDKVAEGELDRDTLLRNFYEPFKKDLAIFGGKGEGKKAAETDVICPQCNEKKLAIRFGKSGEFLGCMGYPECTFTSNFVRDEKGNIELREAEAPKLIEKNCPLCAKPLRQLKGKYGDFISCSGYPECKYVERKTLPFPCPQCGNDIIERAWRGGKFWGCSGYPKCKLAIFDPIEETPCPQCAWPFLTKKTTKEGEVTTICLNKECNYKS